jgi:plastocyanin
MTSWMRIAILGAATMFLLAVLAPVSTGTTTRVHAASGSHGFVWTPTVKRVAKGVKVVWRNPTGAAHTVTSYSRNWKKRTIVGPGGRASRVFRHRGTFLYRCTFHSTLSKGRCRGMCGRIVVG